MSVTPISTSWVCTHTGPKNLKIIYVQASPKMQNNNAYILYGYGINSMVNKAPTNTHVAPVISPFFSSSLIIKLNRLEKNIDTK